LFSESNSRYLVEVTADNYDAFAKRMLNLPFGQIGKVIDEPKLTIKAQDGKTIVDADIDILKQAWQRTFKW
jgi:phosphoribosylformylglycinamidine synthase